MAVYSIVLPISNDGSVRRDLIFSSFEASRSGTGICPSLTAIFFLGVWYVVDRRTPTPGPALPVWWGVCVGVEAEKTNMDYMYMQNQKKNGQDNNNNNGGYYWLMAIVPYKSAVGWMIVIAWKYKMILFNA